MARISTRKQNVNGRYFREGQGKLFSERFSKVLERQQQLLAFSQTMIY